MTQRRLCGSVAHGLRAGHALPRRGVVVLALCASVACAGHRAAPVTTEAEPAYCDPATFVSREVPLAAGGIRRLHAYRLGAVVFAGLAIGQSELSAVRALAESHAAGAATRYCTWYLNRGNPEAARTFNFRYVPHPGGSKPAADAAVYLETLGDSFFRSPVSFLSCSEQKRFLAVGCDGQMHRGPTVFGMVLAFSGCTPEHAARIVNDVWGLNGVPAETRLEIIRAGHELGQANPRQRARLRELFSE